MLYAENVCKLHGFLVVKENKRIVAKAVVLQEFIFL